MANLTMVNILLLVGVVIQTLYLSVLTQPLEEHSSSTINALASPIITLMANHQLKKSSVLGSVSRLVRRQSTVNSQARESIDSDIRNDGEALTDLTAECHESQNGDLDNFCSGIVSSTASSSTATATATATDTTASASAPSAAVTPADNLVGAGIFIGSARVNGSASPAVIQSPSTVTTSNTSTTKDPITGRTITSSTTQRTTTKTVNGQVITQLNNLRSGHKLAAATHTGSVIAPTKLLLPRMPDNIHRRHRHRG